MVRTRDPEAFAGELVAGLVDVGRVRVDGPAADATVYLGAIDDAGNFVREYRFAQSLGEISDAITIDQAAWHSMWPGWSFTAASIAMLSVHVQEAVLTAPDNETILQLVTGGVIAGV